VKLGFGEVLSESFEFFFSRLRLFFHLVTVPWILSIALRVAVCRGSTTRSRPPVPAPSDRSSRLVRGDRRRSRAMQSCARWVPVPGALIQCGSEHAR